MKYEILDIIKREGIYELFFNIYDDYDNLIIGNIFYNVGKIKPTSIEIESLFGNEIYNHILNILKPIVCEKSYTQSEVTQILRDKNYISEVEEFDENMPYKN